MFVGLHLFKNIKLMSEMEEAVKKELKCPSVSVVKNTENGE